MLFRCAGLVILLTLPGVATAQVQAGLSTNQILSRTEQTTHDGFEHAADFDYCATEHEGHTLKTYAVYMLDGSTYEQLVAVNGVAIPAQDLRNLAAAREAETERRNHETPAQHRSRVAQFEAEQHRNRALLKEMPEAFDFELRGKAPKDGWETFVLDVSPRAGYQPKDRMTRVLTGMRGTLWIDRKSFGWVRAEAMVVHPVMIEGFLARVERGTRFAMEERPFGEGYWLPTLFTIHTKARILFLFPTRSKQEYTFFHYVPRGSLLPESCLAAPTPPASTSAQTEPQEH